MSMSYYITLKLDGDKLVVDKLDKVEREARAARGEVERPQTITVKSDGALAKLRDLTVAASGVSAAVRTIARAAEAIIKPAANLEFLEMRLQNLYVSAEKGTKAFKTFIQIASTTPFQIEDVVDAGAQLKAFGMDAEKMIKVAADLAAFMGEDIVFAANSMGRAFAGGAGAADILRERGLLTLIRTTQSLPDLAQVPLEQFREAMIKTFTDAEAGVAGATDRMTATIIGKYSNMQDAVTQLKVAIGDALLPMLKDVVTWMMNFARSVKEVVLTIRGTTNSIEEAAKAAHDSAWKNWSEARTEDIAAEMEANNRRIEQLHKNRQQAEIELNEFIELTQKANRYVHETEETVLEKLAADERERQELEEKVNAYQKALFWLQNYNGGLQDVIDTREKDAAAAATQAAASAAQADALMAVNGQQLFFNLTLDAGKLKLREHRDLVQELAESMAKLFEPVKRQADPLEPLKTSIDELVEAAQNASQVIRNGLSSTMRRWSQGMIAPMRRTKNELQLIFADIMAAFLHMINQMIAKWLAMQAIMGIGSLLGIPGHLLGGLFSPGGGTLPGAGAVFTLPRYATTGGGQGGWGAVPGLASLEMRLASIERAINGVGNVVVRGTMMDDVEVYRRSAHGQIKAAGA